MQTKRIQLNIRTAENTQRGITLIELMVALAVSSIIMLAIANIYSSTKKTAVIHDEFARVQDNIRYVSNTLALNIRNAGYYGCAVASNPTSISNRILGNEFINFNLETGIMGFEAVGSDVGNAPLVIDTTVPSNSAADWVTVGQPAATPTVPTPTAKFINAAGLEDRTTNLNTALPAPVINRAIAGSDILILRTAAGLGIKAAQEDKADTIYLDDTSGGWQIGACPQNAGIANVDGISGICELDVLMMSDCTPRAVIFQATNFARVGGGAVGACDDPTKPCFSVRHDAGIANGENRDPALWSGSRFNTNAEVMRLRTRTYFVGINPPLITEPTLYVRNDASINPDPLIEGVENMQILYGVDTSGNGIANRYFSANNVPDLDGDPSTVFEGVVSIKLSLLVRTPQDMPGINRTLADYANLTYAMVSPASPITIDPIPVDAASTDRRMRKVVNLTINIRNK